MYASTPLICNKWFCLRKQYQHMDALYSDCLAYFRTNSWALSEVCSKKLPVMLIWNLSKLWKKKWYYNNADISALLANTYVLGGYPRYPPKRIIHQADRGSGLDPHPLRAWVHKFLKIKSFSLYSVQCFSSREAKVLQHYEYGKLRFSQTSFTLSSDPSYGKGCTRGYREEELTIYHVFSLYRFIY